MRTDNFYAGVDRINKQYERIEKCARLRRRERVQQAWEARKVDRANMNAAISSKHKGVNVSEEYVLRRKKRAQKAWGVREINRAKWKMDEYKTAGLTVHEKEGQLIKCVVEMRPIYCDRGHLQLNIHGGNLNIDHADSFPRYFFSFEEADAHTRLFLKWRLWKHKEGSRGIPLPMPGNFGYEERL